MSLDEKWNDIFAKKQALVLPGRAPRTLPLPPEGPSCPTHCSGRHEHDGWMACRRCGGKAVRIVLHEYTHQPGHYFTQLEPADGRVSVTTCCGEPLQRRFR